MSTTINEVKVASAMSNMEYRSVSEIALLSDLSSHTVRDIVYSLYSRGLVESTMKGLTPFYRLK